MNRSAVLALGFAALGAVVGGAWLAARTRTLETDRTVRPADPAPGSEAPRDTASKGLRAAVSDDASFGKPTTTTAATGGGPAADAPEPGLDLLSPRRTLEAQKAELLVTPKVGVAWAAALECVALRLSFDGRYSVLVPGAAQAQSPPGHSMLIRFVNGEHRVFSYHESEFSIFAKLRAPGLNPGNQPIAERSLEVGSALWDEVMAFIDGSLALTDS